MRYYYFTKTKLWIRSKKPEAVVTWMRLHDPHPTFNNAAFMRMYADRKKDAGLGKLRTDDETVFVEDLMLHQIISTKKRPIVLVQGLKKFFGGKKQTRVQPEEKLHQLFGTNNQANRIEERMVPGWSLRIAKKPAKRSVFSMEYWTSA